MSATPPTEGEPHEHAWRGPSLAGYVGVSVGMLAVAVLLCVTGAFDQRIAPLWSPGILAAIALGLVYVEPQPPLWQVASAGALLGIAYAVLVVGADALSDLEIHLGTVDVFLRALAIGVAPALAGALLLRWFAPTGRGGHG
jgi:hypothetical protein